MTTPTPESVEQLAEKIARWAYSPVDGTSWSRACIHYRNLVDYFLRSHGIDPATMQAVGGEAFRHAADIEAETPIANPPPPEPVVTERDRLCAMEIATHTNKGPQRFEQIIARHNAEQREELERLRIQVKALWRPEELQSQLAASEKRVKELEHFTKKAMQATHQANADLAWALRYAGTNVGESVIVHKDLPQPSTQPSHEGRE